MVDVHALLSIMCVALKFIERMCVCKLPVPNHSVIGELISCDSSWCCSVCHVTCVMLSCMSCDLCDVIMYVM